MSLRALLPAVALVGLWSPPTLAQVWNDSVATALVTRAVARRTRARADTTLHDYRARAHGFVFFLGQFGEGFEEPPRLVKSDELVVEVYWRAPGRSKQRIVGWRDRADLPTGIEYHRDHLGIVQNNFGDRIGLGHDDEVRNVPHPLAPDGPRRYDYALVDSLAIRLPGRVVRVYEVLTRPRDSRSAAVVGSLYLDAATAELVRFRFNFTRAAYVDKSIEDITIALENGLWDERYWLPRRQEIEIRRRSTWLELPARGIIRGRWEIADYAFNVGLSDSLFGGFEIVAAEPRARAQFAWDSSLESAIREHVGPAVAVDLDEVRAKVREVIAARAVSGLPLARPGVGAISDLLHFNRVEGVALGVGAVIRPVGGRVEIRTWGGYGLGDRRLKARLAIQRPLGRWSLGVRADRVIEDGGDEPVIAPVLNSIVAQEAGDDFGDYVLLHRVRAELRRSFATLGGIKLTAGVEHSTSVENAATPANGSFRANPPLGIGVLGVGTVELELRRPPAGNRAAGTAGAAVELGGRDDRAYLRLHARGALAVPLGPTELAVSARGGWGSRHLSPYRSFAFGGRGSLISEPFRAWGGRYAALGRLEWRVAVPFPAIPLGSFASTGPEMVVAPFVSVGWGGGVVAAVPWQPSEGVRSVAGVAVEWFHRLLKLEVGASLRDRRAGIVIDLRRDLWAIL